MGEALKSSNGCLSRTAVSGGGTLKNKGLGKLVLWGKRKSRRNGGFVKIEVSAESRDGLKAQNQIARGNAPRTHPRNRKALKGRNQRASDFALSGLVVLGGRVRRALPYAIDLRASPYFVISKSLVIRSYIPTKRVGKMGISVGRRFR